MQKFIYIVFFALVGFCFQQKPWKLALNKDGIKVFTRKTDSSTIKELKVTIQVKSPIDTVLKKILDIKNLKYWSYRIAESSLIKKVNDSVWIFYIHNDVEWPVKDRDHISKVQLKKEKNGYTLLLSPLNSLVKEKKDVVRLKHFSGAWILKRLDANHTEVTQQLYGNPESNIPPFFINMMITKAPFYTFQNMKNQLEANINR
ncbi:MAG: START domain-containing protein [Limnohabitans sp.]|nr:START domain-containing protein [Limnohabitans sp.]